MLSQGIVRGLLRAFNGWPLGRPGAEQGTGADALQLTLRFSFRARLTASVRPQGGKQSMSALSVTPEPILQVCAGLWAAGALKSGVDLKLFDALAAGPQDVAALSH